MPFIDEILKYKSVSFVGMEKNTGKTQTLNYVLKRLGLFYEKKIGLTSIGIDGEKEDILHKTSKPEIIINPNTIFVTDRTLYRQKEVVSDILYVTQRRTALGEIVYAEAKTKGKVLLSGPSTTKWLKEVVEKLNSLGCDIVLVDGALDRRSLSSPLITDAMILSTGAVLSRSEKIIAKKTYLLYLLTLLEKTELSNKLMDIDNGIYSITDNEEIIPLNIPSTLMIESYKDVLFSYGYKLFISGIITDKLLLWLKMQKNVENIEIIVKDFTKIFCSKEALDGFFHKGGKLKVVYPANLIAITVNPFSPSNGYHLNSDNIIKELKKYIKDIPIYNIIKSATDLY